jgi:hypothetical protein
MAARTVSVLILATGLLLALWLGVASALDEGQASSAPPQFAVEPSFLESRLPAEATEVQDLLVSNLSVTATLHYSLSVLEGAHSAGIVPWLDVHPTLGTLAPGEQNTITVRFQSLNYMLPGELYFANIWAWCDATVPPTTVVVPLILEIVPPPLAVSPEALSATLHAGQSAEVPISLTNGAETGLAYTVTVAGPHPAGWLGVTPATGTISAGQEFVVTATLAAAGVPPGGHTATLSITNDLYPGWFLTVPARLQVESSRIYLPLLRRH